MIKANPISFISRLWRSRIRGEHPAAMSRVAAKLHEETKYTALLRPLLILHFHKTEQEVDSTMIAYLITFGGSRIIDAETVEILDRVAPILAHGFTRAGFEAADAAAFNRELRSSILMAAFMATFRRFQLEKAA